MPLGPAKNLRNLNILLFIVFFSKAVPVITTGAAHKKRESLYEIWLTSVQSYSDFLN